MPVVIPERTIDALFAFEFLSAAPTAVLWSPNATNPGTTKGVGPTASPGNIDHEVDGHRRFDVECKTIYSNASGAWVNEISNRQLRAYVANAKAPMFYLLPSKPVYPDSPWRRHCVTDPDVQGRCRACSNPSKDSGPAYFRRWSGQELHYRNLPPERKLQPWFNHWSWCVRPADLVRHISPAGGLPWSGTTEIPALDVAHAGIAGAVRLCHFLDAVATDWRAQASFLQSEAKSGDAAGSDPGQLAVNLNEWSLQDPTRGDGRAVDLSDGDEDDTRFVQVTY
ncbi:hypothetical protein [Microbacterium sp.]|uniref:hypothetical protein n=1 Tax=Microbacterium sp. TaxID=51671 RepID=UPI00391D9EC9